MFPFSTVWIDSIRSFPIRASRPVAELQGRVRWSRARTRGIDHGRQHAANARVMMLARKGWLIIRRWLCFLSLLSSYVRDISDRVINLLQNIADFRKPYKWVEKYCRNYISISHEWLLLSGYLEIIFFSPVQQNKSTIRKIKMVRETKSELRRGEKLRRADTLIRVFLGVSHSALFCQAVRHLAGSSSRGTLAEVEEGEGRARTLEDVEEGSMGRAGCRERDEVKWGRRKGGGSSVFADPLSGASAPDPPFPPRSPAALPPPPPSAPGARANGLG